MYCLVLPCGISKVLVDVIKYLYPMNVWGTSQKSNQIRQGSLQFSRFCFNHLVVHHPTRGYVVVLQIIKVQWSDLIRHEKSSRDCLFLNFFATISPLKWVLECYTLLNCQPEIIISSEQRKQYLENLAKTREDWQVKQADQAIRLYLFFLSRVGQHPVPTDDTGRSWEQAVENMINALRLKHMSLIRKRPISHGVDNFKDILKNAQKNFRPMMSGIFCHILQ